jgi:putative transposase
MRRLPRDGWFKCFAIEQDEHFLSLGRYVERNALRANLVARAQDWRWCSLWRRELLGDRQADGPVLSEWSVQRAGGLAGVGEHARDAGGA